MDRIFYGIGTTLTLGGLCLFDYRLALVVAGAVCLVLGFVFDFLPGKAEE